VTTHEHVARLTSRERQVLASLCAGHSSKVIAAEMHIMPRTVESYINNMRNKLGAANRTHLVAIAIGCGLCAADGK
jgi:DNA-binding NarL/FixJ family response regulator